VAEHSRDLPVLGGALLLGWATRPHRAPRNGALGEAFLELAGKPLHALSARHLAIS
jgi:hypothetical protein